MLTITPEQSRRIDQIACSDFEFPSLLLMENASLNCANWLWDRFADQPLFIICGTGNNGGDGLAIARHWTVRGGSVRVMLVGSPESLSADAIVQWRMIRALGMPVAYYNSLNQPTAESWSNESRPASPPNNMIQLADNNWTRWCGDLCQTIVVDALLGTGARGALRAPLPAVIDYLNTQAPQKIAIDIPSGLDGLNGKPMPVAIRAQQTLTFVAPKTGFYVESAHEWLGDVVVIDIGAPQQAIQRAVQQTVND